MLPNRYIPGQSSAIRKSRLEGKPSLLPKLRQGSTDRMSTESRRPSTTGLRSSSAEPARGTFGSRLSKEASASKLPINRRSRSQTGEPRYGDTAATPQRGSYYPRPTTTPVRTPSQERVNRNWQTSLERALAFVTIKDQRPLSAVSWQRAEGARVAEALAARGAGGALLRPLTIARFVDIAAALLAPALRDAKLNNDNYVAKLPHLSKRLLYPGAVSKSWLRTVNTLHAFPHALALIAYLLDLVTHIEMPVSDEWLYVGKDELSRLRRDYLNRCWIRFQDPGHQFEDLNEQYLQNLQKLLGNDEEKIAELQQVINRYEQALEDEEVQSARAQEAQLSERCSALNSAVKTQRARRRRLAADCAAQRARSGPLADAARGLAASVDRARAEIDRLRVELESQTLSVEERTRLLDEVDYSLRVHDSKRALTEDIAKTVVAKENELALWQRRALDSCRQYKQALIQLAPTCPRLPELAVDETELMEAECGVSVCSAVEQLRAHAASLQAARAERTRTRTARARRTNVQREEARTKINELKSAIQREQQALENEISKENAEAGTWSADEVAMMHRIEDLRSRQQQYKTVDDELQMWEEQDQMWTSRLTALRAKVTESRDTARRLLQRGQAQRAALAKNVLAEWNKKLEIA